MRTRLIGLLVAGTLCALSLFAQKPKSKKEIEALNAINAATTVDDRIKAIDHVLTSFADTEYKTILLTMAMQLEEQKGDFAQTTFYAQQLLDADPKNSNALATMALETAHHTREFDLDKEEKLAKVDKWAKDAIEDSKTMPKPRADLSDEQLDSMRKDVQSEGYEALAISATLRKKNDDAITNFKQALSLQAKQDPGTQLRLGQVYIDSGKFDDAATLFDQALNNPISTAQVKQIATAKKAEIAKLKASPAPAPKATQ